MWACSLFLSLNMRPHLPELALMSRFDSKVMEGNWGRCKISSQNFKPLKNVGHYSNYIIVHCGTNSIHVGQSEIKDLLNTIYHTLSRFFPFFSVGFQEWYSYQQYLRGHRVFHEGQFECLSNVMYLVVYWQTMTIAVGYRHSHKRWLKYLKVVDAIFITNLLSSSIKEGYRFCLKDTELLPA